MHTLPTTLQVPVAEQTSINSCIVKTEMFHSTAKLFEDFLVPPSNVTVELN